MAAKNFGAIPPVDPAGLTEADEALLAVARAGFATVGDLIGRHRQKQAIGEAMRVVAEANRYLSDQAPWKLKDEADKPRMGTILHVALQVVSDANTLLTPFLPHSAQKVHELLGGTGVHAPMPVIEEVDDLDGGPGVPGAHRGLHRRRALGVGAAGGGPAAGRAEAGLPQARPVDRRRGTGPAGRLNARRPRRQGIRPPGGRHITYRVSITWSSVTSAPGAQVS